MKRTELCQVSTWSDRFNTQGQLSLLHVSDTIHVVEYKDSERSIAIDIDLIELRDVDSTVRFTFPRGSGDRLVFRIDDNAQFSVLCQAREDCQAICDLKLRLNSILRDSYYSGVYSNLDPDAKLILCDEVERMKKENPGVFFSSLLNSAEVRNDSAKLVHQRTKSDGNHVILNEVVCVFCDVSKIGNRELDFLVHPYVPKYSSGRHIFMCGICVENWKEYRETAEHEGQLILPGEINEEICAICSDTPSTLVMCGQCPRSFCDNCLLRTLTHQEYANLQAQADADWVCMCCDTGLSRNPSLLRTAWKAVVPYPGRRGIHHGSIVPFTQATQASLKVDAKQPNGDAARLKSALKGSASIDQAVASSAPLLSALANKRAAQAFGSPLSAEDDDISECSSPQPTRGAAPRRGRFAAEQHYPQQPMKSTPTTPQSSTTSGRGAGRGGRGWGRGAGRGGRGGRSTTTSASYALEDVDAAVHLQAQYKLAHPNNDRGKRMQKRKGQGQGHGDDPTDIVGSGSAATATATAGPVLDEKYYFGQYVGYYALLCEEINQRKAVAIANSGKRKRALTDVPTDDVCFLCKDGGDLIECDWTCPTGKGGERCLKVYHTYCLDFEVSDERWCCPRHYCDMCGVQSLKYICKYCPVSICANCPSSLVSKYGHARYCVVTDALAGEWCHAPTAAGVQSIVCQSCTEMLESIERDASQAAAGTAGAPPVKGAASVELVRNELQTQKRFPGTYAGGSKGGAASIYLKEAPPQSSAMSSDGHTDTTEKVVYTGRRGKRNNAVETVVKKAVEVEVHPSEPTEGSSAENLSEATERPADRQSEVETELLEKGEEEATAIEVETHVAQVEGNPVSAEGATITVTDGPMQNSDAAATISEAEAASVAATSTSTAADVETDVARALLSMNAPASTTSRSRKGSRPPRAAAAGTAKATREPCPPASPRDNATNEQAAVVEKEVENGKDEIPEKADTTKSAKGKASNSSTNATEPKTASATAPSSSPRGGGDSPPKKRAASSLAQFNITMQLKGDAAVDGRSPRSASSSVGEASKSNDANAKKVGPKVTPAGTPSKGDTKKAPAKTLPPAAGKHDRSGKSRSASTGSSFSAATATATAPSATSKQQKPAQGDRKDADSSSDEEEVIHIAKRVTRSREAEVALSTRSGKKLVLAGSDLLPGLD